MNRLFGCIYAVVGLRTVLERDEGLVCLINLGVFWSHTDGARGLDFFSTTPKEHWKGSQGLRDCEAEKGLIPSVGWVWVS